MFLLDTNIWLELLLEQEKADQVRRLFESYGAQQFALTDFSLHSLGVVLTRLGKHDLFLRFLSDTLEDSIVQVIRLNTAGLEEVPAVCHRFRLDFDDAYQYLCAKENNLTLVSFDSDFDRTDHGRKTPAELITLNP
jgi:hypothetical protein